MDGSMAAAFNISIRVPRGRDDIDAFRAAVWNSKFQSASLVGGTTQRGVPHKGIAVISIRVPRGRDDVAVFSCAAAADYFNPRPSWEGRRALIVI